MYNGSVIMGQCVSDDKEKRREVREKSLLKYQEKLSSASRSKAEKQNAEKKYSLETMMKVTYSATPQKTYILHHPCKK